MSERNTEFPMYGENIVQRMVERCVWHVSTFGSLLWNVGYNYMLEIAIHTSVHLICYSDDSLLVAYWTSWESTIKRAQAGMNVVIEKIHEFEHEPAGEVTEALFVF